MIGGEEKEWDSGKGHMTHERGCNYFCSFNSVIFFFFIVNNCIRNVIDSEIVKS